MQGAAVRAGPGLPDPTPQPRCADGLPQVRLRHEHHDRDREPPGAGAGVAGRGQVLGGQEGAGQGEGDPCPAAPSSPQCSHTSTNRVWVSFPTGLFQTPCPVSASPQVIPGHFLGSEQGVTCPITQLLKGQTWGWNLRGLNYILQSHME